MIAYRSALRTREYRHIPVLLTECIDYLDLDHHPIFVDATLGFAIHLDAVGPALQLAVGALLHSIVLPTLGERAVHEPLHPLNAPHTNSNPTQNAARERTWVPQAADMEAAVELPRARRSGNAPSMSRSTHWLKSGASNA